MLGVSRLLGAGATETDHLRYGPRRTGERRRPVVVWTTTRRCNLHCMHCYADSYDRPFAGELSTAEAQAMLRDLGDYGVPVILFSGGEPLARPDLFALAAYAHECGIRTTLSTNGTLITPAVAERIRATGFGYVGVSLDGIGRQHDKFRGQIGAFDAALNGIRHCRAAGQRVGLRLTLTRRTVAALPAILDLVEREGINRVCFYHLVGSGRGRRIAGDALSAGESRRAVDAIVDAAADWQRRGREIEVLTVDNHADGPHLYLRTLRERGPDAAAEVWALLHRNGGNGSGVTIGHIDNTGDVHIDQFSWDYRCGNVREQPFSAIWETAADPLLAGLRDRAPRLPARCQGCRFLAVCNGNLRTRAFAATGDWWGADPGCYLSDDEIAPIAEPRASGGDTR
jgi:radical SAM protein with 4Fe4S-binding SPASM domain